jgi:hypothetical protein
MNHSFNIDIASKYGVIPAVLLENLAFWILKNKANEKNFYDGDFWTYNSIKAFSKLFPYLSEKQIRLGLKKLIEAKLIKTGQYNKNSYDRTMWYALEINSKSIYLKEKNDLPKKETPFAQKGKPIPYINTYINTDKEINKEKPQSLKLKHKKEMEIMYKRLKRIINKDISELEDFEIDDLNYFFINFQTLRGILNSLKDKYDKIKCDCTGGNFNITCFYFKNNDYEAVPPFINYNLKVTIAHQSLQVKKDVIQLLLN